MIKYLLCSHVVPQYVEFEECSKQIVWGDKKVCVIKADTEKLKKTFEEKENYFEENEINFWARVITHKAYDLSCIDINKTDVINKGVFNWIVSETGIVDNVHLMIGSLAHKFNMTPIALCNESYKNPTLNTKEIIDNIPTLYDKLVVMCELLPDNPVEKEIIHGIINKFDVQEGDDKKSLNKDVKKEIERAIKLNKNTDIKEITKIIFNK